MAQKGKTAFPGKAKFKNTTFGARAIAGAKRGGPRDSVKLFKGAEPSSVQTQTNDIPGRRGRTDVSVNPVIRKSPITGNLTILNKRDATIIAEKTGDFVRVRAKRGETPKQTQDRGDAKSRKFSKRLGKISAKAAKKRAKKAE